MAYQLTSPVFEHKQAIPEKYTCKGKNISPELKWNDPPQGTAAYGLIMDDPDAPAGTWVHWVIYNIPGVYGVCLNLFQMTKKSLISE